MVTTRGGAVRHTGSARDGPPAIFAVFAARSGKCHPWTEDAKLFFPGSLAHAMRIGGPLECQHGREDDKRKKIVIEMKSKSQSQSKNGYERVYSRRDETFP